MHQHKIPSFRCLLLLKQMFEFQHDFDLEFQHRAGGAAQMMRWNSVQKILPRIETNTLLNSSEINSKNWISKRWKLFYYFDKKFEIHNRNRCWISWGSPWLVDIIRGEIIWKYLDHHWNDSTQNERIILQCTSPRMKHQIYLLLY